MMQAVTLPVNVITAAQLTQMFELMEAHYDAVDYHQFAADFVEKDGVVLLRNPAGNILGFSTFTCSRFTHTPASTPVRVLYSGDTIIDRRYWGTQTLAFEWIYQAGRQKARYPEDHLYWFLISKGPRTYRYLSAFSRSYWPHYAIPTPVRMRELMHALATARFNAHYDRLRGVVHFPSSRGHLREEFAQVDAIDRQRPEVEFFLAANPGYVRGDELVCVTELTGTNLKPLSRRIFEKGLREHLVRSDAPCLETFA